MSHTPDLSPDALARARATLNVKAASDPDIAAIRNAWASLKAQRGQVVRPALLAPAHIIETPPQAELGTVALIDEARARTSLAVRESMDLREIRAAHARAQADFDGAA